jgi:atypical dual specificity phosphatase
LGTGGLFLRKLRARVADEPTGFVWVEPGKVAGSGYPASKAQVEWLAKEGVRSILTLTSDTIPDEWTKGLDLVMGHVVMEDHRAPSVWSMEKGVEFVVEQLRGGRTVLVHCLAGEGRTGCVLAAYLVAEKGMGPEEALRHIRGIKPQFVERAQEKAVYDFADTKKL